MPSTHVMNNNKYGIRDYDDQEGDLAGLGGPLGGNENKSHPILKSDNWTYYLKWAAPMERNLQQQLRVKVKQTSIVRQ